MQPLIKWPGGKTSELKIISEHLPSSYERYVEPFFGGGAVYFDKCPKTAIINDISQNLMSLYGYVGSKNQKFKRCVVGIAEEWELLKEFCSEKTEFISSTYYAYTEGELEKDDFLSKVSGYADVAVDFIASKSQVISDKEIFRFELRRTVADKLLRTAENEKKYGGLSQEDLQKNILTGFTAGYYMYMRSMLNAMEKDRYLFISHEYKIAVFFFVREFCYGAMFRYNKNGDFNIPYGGIGYNGKDFKRKVEALFDGQTVELLSGATTMSVDFEQVFALATPTDFFFLDPPYDSDFSDYEANAFGKEEHKRLAQCIYSTPAKFLLIIKNTPFIADLYENKGFNIFAFDNKYSYCVRGRNDRNAEHLIITNY